MLDRLVNGYDPAVRRHRIRLEVQGTQSIAFDGGDARPARERGADGPQARTRIQIDDGAALPDQSNDVRDKVADQVPVPLKECQHVAPQPDSRAGHFDGVRDARIAGDRVGGTELPLIA